MLIPAIQENPWLLKTPIVRYGNRITQGYAPEEWDKWA
jgi:arsenate reductase-like glutaredoxin family protein